MTWVVGLVPFVGLVTLVYGIQKQNGRAFVVGAVLFVLSATLLL